MGLASRQIKRELNRIIEKKLKNGFVPSIQLLKSELLKFYKNVSVGDPSFKPRMQPYRKVWNVNNYNQNLEEIYNDLNNLYDEIVQQFTTTLEHFDYNDTERKRILHQINSLDGDVTDLLLSAEDVDGYLYSVHDTFIDRSKIDLRYSTCEINTVAGVVMLRESRNGIKKIDMSHYYDVEQYPILAEEKYASKIMSNKLYSGSKFGYAFSDMNMAWSQKIITNSSGELEVSFIVELDPSQDDEIPISRIEALGHFTRMVTVEPLWSVDNVNFKAFPIDSSLRSKPMQDGKTQIWNFPETRIQFLKFIITMHEEDGEAAGFDVPAYLYNIGFKNISIFQTAYIPESVLYSKEFPIIDVTGEPLTVDKVSLTTDEDIPPSTEIKHYVSLGSSASDNPENYNWVAISPANDPKPSQPQVVDFRHVAFLNGLPLLQWDDSSYDSPVDSKNGIDFYVIYRFPYEPIRDTVEIYRGHNDWQVIPKYEIERKAIYDESHTFDAGNTGTEYITLNNPDFTPVSGDGLIRGSVRVKSSSGENPDYVYTTPNDYIIDYNTMRITRTKDSAPLRSDGATIYVDYQYDKETAEPTVYKTYIYIINPDGIDVYIRPFKSVEIEANQFTRITTNGEETNLSSATEYHIPPGWHKVETTGEPRSASDRFYLTNGNKYLYDLVYRMYAYGEKLQEVSYFDLKNNVLKSDHSKYCIVDYDGDGNKEMIVNYRPQTEKYSSVPTDYNNTYDLLDYDSEPETYDFTYKYIADSNDKIFYKAVLSRDDIAGADITPTLREYTIRIGY